jgi:hypothetical protein
LVGKAAGAQGRQPYQLHVPIILKPECHNLLEPSGPFQAFKGISLSFTLRPYTLSHSWTEAFAVFLPLPKLPFPVEHIAAMQALSAYKLQVTDDEYLEV